VSSTLGDEGTRPGEERDDNGLTMKFCWCPPGSFRMGSPPDEPGRAKTDASQVSVTLSRGFWMGKYEVTQEQWRRVMGTSLRDKAGSDLAGEDPIIRCTT
jgi:formylglycine-generating enzyme required for sulfatase activity